jgi:hypothetical protein
MLSFSVLNNFHLSIDPASLSAFIAAMMIVRRIFSERRR